MNYVGNLDKTKLGIYSDNLITDSVILTQERIKHIQKRHPGDYEKYIELIPEIIKNPNYILKDKDKEDTILVLKTFANNSDNVQIVIKLNMDKNEKYRSNSILTFWHIRNRNLKSVLKNNELIYEKI